MTIELVLANERTSISNQLTAAGTTGVGGGGGKKKKNKKKIKKNENKTKLI